MTNEIIIDGINVINCEYFNSKYEGCHCYNTKQECYAITPNEHTSCKGVNCHYKQLKRKEQEIKNICKAFDIEYAIDEETGNLIGRCNKLYKKEQECEKYKQVLDKIKEIAKNMNNECFYDDFECKDCDMKNGCTYFNKKQILQEISEEEEQC